MPSDDPPRTSATEPRAPAQPGPRVTAAPDEAPTEIVHRPDAGTLARGSSQRWAEAPPWAFYAAAAIVLLAAAFYLVRRLRRPSR